MTSIDVHLPRIQRLANGVHPDTGACEDGEWCYSAVPLISAYLSEQNVEHTAVTPATGRFVCDAGSCAHAWITLADGTIVDPTITQFADVDAIDEFPFRSCAYDVAVVAPDDDFAACYRTTV